MLARQDFFIHISPTNYDSCSYLGETSKGYNATYKVRRHSETSGYGLELGTSDLRGATLSRCDVNASASSIPWSILVPLGSIIPVSGVKSASLDTLV